MAVKKPVARKPIVKKRVQKSKSAGKPLALLIGTRKGAFILKADPKRRVFKLSAPLYLGHIIHHFVQDPRDRRTMVIAARTGHLGHTVFYSRDQGKSWKESSRPPAFAKVPEGQQGRVVDHVFWLTPGHTSEPGVWYAGTSPQGLFRSTDGGDTWDGVAGFNESPSLSMWAGGDGTPDGPKMHSVIVDPRDANHLYIAMSSGGAMESLDRGVTWQALIDGMETIPGFDPSNQTYQDPHCMRLHPANPDRLYLQHHFGIYRLDRPSRKWVRIGRNMPKEAGDAGFPMVVHPRDADTCWVFPMDGSEVWPRTSLGGKPAVYVTKNAGKTWQRLNRGLPAKEAWFTVKRQAMTADAENPVGLYFGTTSGEIWGSRDEGKTWKSLVAHLPHIYTVEVATMGR